ncbi:MAG TPA: cupin domain-containing protein [Thermoanaerobaculia bacterium]
MTTIDVAAAKRADEIRFDDLIAPVDREHFFTAYWEREPLLTSGRDPHFFRSLFALRDVDHYIARHRPRAGKGIDLVTSDGFVADNYMHGDGVANLRLVTESYLAGSTIVLSGLEETWEPLVRLSRAIEGELSHPISMTVYATPPRFRGVKPHFDTQENFLLQVEGTKTWRVWKPVQELPPVEGSYVPVTRDRLGEPIFEGVMHPGDSLYIPRGFVHEGVAGDDPSLHVTVDVHVRTWEDFVNDAVAAMAARDPRFRRSLPVGFLNGDPAALESELRDFLASLHQHARVSDAIAKHAEMLIVKKTPPADGHFSSLHAEIGPQTLLIRRGTGATRVFEESGVAGIQFEGNQVIGPAKIASALQHVAEHDSLTPASLPDVLNPNEKLVLARRLVRAGLLMLAERA